MNGPASPAREDDARRPAWEESYGKGQNFVFYPHEEIIRFLARHVRRRTGLAEFEDVMPGAASAPFLDAGCGIGRHLVLGHAFGFDVRGIDLSETAVAIARDWLAAEGVPGAAERVQQGDLRALPWPDGHFAVAVSHGVYDSMPFEMAEAAMAELRRVCRPGARIYCDLIAGAPRDEVVDGPHETGTVQSYFDEARIDTLLGHRFESLERVLVTREAMPGGEPMRRWHLALAPKGSGP